MNTNTASPAAFVTRVTAAFLAAHPGLNEALMVDHRIIADIGARLLRWGSISEKQVALVLRLAGEARSPRPEEARVAAPQGKVMVRGTVVSTKVHQGDFGTSYKMVVKVQAEGGSWLCWSTVPAAVLEEAAAVAGNGSALDVVRGCEVEFTATLSRGNDAHFAFAKRPAGARIVSMPVQR